MVNYNTSISQQQLSDLVKNFQQLNQQQSQALYPAAMYTPPVQMPVQSRQVQYVQGINGAKIYQDSLPSNSSEIIMDKDNNIFYMVSKDANGTPSKNIPVGKFTLEEVANEEPVYLTRQDLDDFKKEIRDLLKSQKEAAIE